ncbi:hypothetical protein EYC59_00010 [Candidatus Saccharibacteria bacterium]|nr:MAG: hypothetical protein EYC59_00010 [Candidatus Saccharibacteria bacterium]
MSKQPTLEQQLIAAGQGKGSNDTFVRHTMQAIEKASASAAFASALTPQKPRRYTFIHLTKVGLVALIFAACALVSGTAYAVYNLWLKPSAEVQSVEKKYGRDQAQISLKNCQLQASEDVTVEITKGTDGTAEEAAQNLAAQCEVEAIMGWAMQSFGLGAGSVQEPFTVRDVDATSLTGTFGDTNDRQTFRLNKDTVYLYQGKFLTNNDIYKGDIIAVAGDRKGLRAVVKLTYPSARYYSPKSLNTYHERYNCTGNADSSCIQLPNLDVLRDGEGGANPGAVGNPMEIQGKLVEQTPTQFTLQATSGKIYTVHTATDVIGIFNAGNPYGPVTIEPGDVVMVRYDMPAGGNPQDIPATQYHEIQLMLQGFDKQAKSADNSVKYHY